MSELVVRINPSLCDGCGDCIPVCSEEVLFLKDGKARLTDAAYCVGFGECLSACPTGALSLEARPHACPPSR